MVERIGWMRFAVWLKVRSMKDTVLNLNKVTVFSSWKTQTLSPRQDKKYWYRPFNLSVVHSVLVIRNRISSWIYNYCLLAHHSRVSTGSGESTHPYANTFKKRTRVAKISGYPSPLILSSARDDSDPLYATRHFIAWNKNADLQRTVPYEHHLCFISLSATKQERDTVIPFRA